MDFALAVIGNATAARKVAAAPDRHPATGDQGYV
jgi:hypothetical protein